MLRKVEEEFTISDFEDEDDLCIDTFRGLESIYGIERPKKLDPIFRDIVFELDGKRYKFQVEEIS